MQGSQRRTEPVCFGREIWRRRRRPKPPMPTNDRGRWLTSFCPPTALYCRVDAVWLSSSTGRTKPASDRLRHEAPIMRGARSFGQQLTLAEEEDDAIVRHREILIVIRVV